MGGNMTTWETWVNQNMGENMGENIAGNMDISTFFL